MQQKKSKQSKSIQPSLADIKEEVDIYDEMIKLQEGLPFLYAWPNYKWAREFIESTNQTNLLCAANQISKSSTQIRKCLMWCTDKTLWPRLWRTRPQQFWYFYPSTEIVESELETKWINEQLPAGRYKDDPIYGWELKKKSGKLVGIDWNSGLKLRFHTYSQKPSALQASTIGAIFADEEMPMDIYDELFFRTTAVKGYFHMVFTATLGQSFWRLALEPKEHEEEKLPGAWKRQISMYDCLTYEDGTPSHWKIEDIERIKARCKDENEVLRRVYGKFILDVEGKLYPNFSISENMKPVHKLPADWQTYVGVDSGSGGQKNHPAAIVFVGVDTDMKSGRVYLGWRGDPENTGGKETTAGDVLEKLRELKTKNKISPVIQVYDQSAKDFGIIAGRINEPVLTADKDRERGEKLLNTLFKEKMLFIYETEELHKLAVELMSLRRAQPKERAKDDFIDALRYAVMHIPWDFSDIGKDIEIGQDLVEEKKPLTLLELQMKERRESVVFDSEEDYSGINGEIREWNDLFDAE